MSFEEIELDKIVRVSGEEMAERRAAEEAARADAEALAAAQWAAESGESEDGSGDA